MTIEDLEKLLEKGVPDLTMSEIASKLKISQNFIRNRSKQRSAYINDNG